MKKTIQTSQQKLLLVLITGGAAAGKTTLAKQLKEHLEQNKQEVVNLSLNSYYSYSPLFFQSRNPIPHEIFQWEELNQDLEILLAGESIYSPTYNDLIERKFTCSTVLVKSTPIIVVEGMLAFFREEIRKKSDLKIYLEVAEKTRNAILPPLDPSCRGESNKPKFVKIQSLDSLKTGDLERRLKRYKQGLEEGKFNKPIEYEIERFYKGCPKENQETYVRPTKQYADLVINNNNFEGNVKKVNVEKVVAMIEEKLEGDSQIEVISKNN